MLWWLQKSFAQRTAAEVLPMGLSADHEYCQFKAKVNADKVSQVDVGVKYTDVAGKILKESGFAWQNIVKGTQNPIVKGQTYESKHPALEDSVK